MAIDWLRGLSAQAVLIGHAVTAVGYEPAVLFQNVGVVVFFTLSGFLITFTALRKPASYGFANFLVDRGARIFTPYIPALAFIVLAGWAFSLSGPIGIGTDLANLAMLQDFPLYRYVSFVPEFDRIGTGRPLWSVAVEWWLYMAFAGLLLTMHKPWWAWLLIVPGLFVVAFHATVGMLAYTWFAAALGAVLFPRLPRIPLIVPATLAALSFYRLLIKGGEVYDLSLQLLLVATFLTGLKAMETWSFPSLMGKAGAGIAAFSYTLYLVHYTVMQAIPDSALSPIPRIIAVCVAANVVAVAMWWLFERHYKTVARWLNTWPPLGINARVRLVKPAAR